MKKTLLVLALLSLLLFALPALAVGESGVIFTVITPVPKETEAPGDAAQPAEIIVQETAAPAPTVFVNDDPISFTTERGTFTAKRSAEEIDLGNFRVPNTTPDYQAFENFLSQFPNLKKVNMFSTEIYRNRVEELAALFPQIEFGWTMVIPCNNPLHPERTPHKIRTDITAYSTLHNNQCTLHTTEELSILRYCRHLKALDIGHNDVTDISFLYDLPQLKVLILGINKNLTDITPLSVMTELEYLELFSNNVSDISPLANCVSLVDLNISYNNINDLTPLMGLKNLRRLFVFSSNNRWGNGQVPGSVISQLRNALPGCTVDNYTGGAIEAWRTHPRYDTIYEMFWGTTYIPFTTLQ